MAAYFSEVGYTDSPENFFEVAVPTGTDVSGYSIAIYNATGVLQTTMSFEPSVGTMQGQDIHAFDSASPGYLEYGASEAIALIDDLGKVVQFVSFENNTVTPSTGPAAGETSTSLGFLSSGETFESADDGSTYYAQSTPSNGTVFCYAAGTLIHTPDGPRAVEMLRLDDLVLTVDNGPQPIRWVRRSNHEFKDVEVDARPVLIQAGALGKNRPAQNLIVSPQHRILVGGGGQLTPFFEAEALAPAKALTKLAGIRHMKGKARMIWVHFAFDGHEVVTANGCLSESLLLGQMVINGLSRKHPQAMAQVFSERAISNLSRNYPAARPCLTVGEARRKVASHIAVKDLTTAREIRKWDMDAEMDRHEAQAQHDHFAEAKAEDTPRKSATARS